MPCTRCRQADRPIVRPRVTGIRRPDRPGRTPGSSSRAILPALAPARQPSGHKYWPASVSSTASCRLGARRVCSRLPPPCAGRRRAGWGPVHRGIPAPAQYPLNIFPRVATGPGRFASRAAGTISTRRCSGDGRRALAPVMLRCSRFGIGVRRSPVGVDALIGTSGVLPALSAPASRYPKARKSRALFSS